MGKARVVTSLLVAWAAVACSGDDEAGGGTVNAGMGFDNAPSLSGGGSAGDEFATRSLLGSFALLVFCGFVFHNGCRLSRKSIFSFSS